VKKDAPIKPGDHVVEESGRPWIVVSISDNGIAQVQGVGELAFMTSWLGVEELRITEAVQQRQEGREST
jgi:hypothetical protein